MFIAISCMGKAIPFLFHFSGLTKRCPEIPVEMLDLREAIWGLK